MGQSHVLISFHICSLLDDHVFVRPLLIIIWIYLKLHLAFQIFVTTNCFLARCSKNFVLSNPQAYFDTF